MNENYDNTTAKDKLHVKAILQGSLLKLISNLIYIGNNYLVSWTELAAPEVALVRGALQVLLFGVLVLRTRETGVEISGTKNSRIVCMACSVRLQNFQSQLCVYCCYSLHANRGSYCHICFT